MSKLSEARKGMRPAPVYEAHFSNGVRLRMSFFNRSDRPIDFEAGRRFVVGMYQTDMRVPAAMFVRGSDGVMRRPWSTCNAGVALTRAYVFHPSIGQVEHDLTAPVSKPRKRTVGTVALQALALRLVREFEGTPDAAKVWEAVAGMRAALGLPGMSGRNASP